MIQLEQLEDMFADIAANGRWDMTQPMLWGYFFTDRSQEKLEQLANDLATRGYRFVDIFVPELDPGEDEYFFLHVEKEEVHTPTSLHDRNQILDALASEHNVDNYDGMDVGPIQDNNEPCH